MQTFYYPDVEEKIDDIKASIYEIWGQKMFITIKLNTVEHYTILHAYNFKYSLATRLMSFFCGLNHEWQPYPTD